MPYMPDVATCRTCSRALRACVMSRKSRSTVKKNRTMKLYFVIDMTGQLYDHVTLTMWKLSKTRFLPFWTNVREAKRLSLLCLLIYTDFMVFWHQSTLCKVINQAANSVKSDLPAFSSVQTTSLWRVLYYRRAKSLSRKLRNEGAKVLSVIFWRF